MVHTAPIRGDFPSIKLDRMVRYRSSIERDLLYFLEFWQDVSWYQEQPLTIEHVMLDGKCRRYTPAYEVHQSGAKILADCKSEERLNSDRAKIQREIGERWASKNGYRFLIYTDTALRAGHQLTNVKLFWRYARLRGVHPQQRILSCIQSRRWGSVQTVSHELQLSTQQVMPVICHLLFHHTIEIDMQCAFTQHTSFKIVESKSI